MQTNMKGYIMGVEVHKGHRKGVLGVQKGMERTQKGEKRAYNGFIRGM